MAPGVAFVVALLIAGSFRYLGFLSVSHACQAYQQSCVTVSGTFLSSSEAFRSVSSEDARIFRESVLYCNYHHPSGLGSQSCGLQL